MRHFFRRKLGLTQARLSRGMFGRAFVRALVFGPGAPQRLPAPDGEALLIAVDLPAIAHSANADLFLAAGAMKQAQALFGRRIRP